MIRVRVDVQRHAPAWKALPRASALARRAAKAAVVAHEGQLRPDVSLAVALADDAMVRRANRDWRGIDKATNVLSFPAVPPERIASAPFLGDVILAFETVAAEALGDGKTLADHAAHLIVHGVLHLLGHDHMTVEEAERMEKLERRALAGLGVPDPYAGVAPMDESAAPDA